MRRSGASIPRRWRGDSCSAALSRALSLAGRAGFPLSEAPRESVGPDRLLFCFRFSSGICDYPQVRLSSDRTDMNRKPKLAARQ